MAQNARTSSTPIHVRLRLHAQLNTASSMLTFHILGAFSSNIIPRQFYAVASTLRCYLFYFTRVQFITSSFNQITALIIPVLTTFLQIKYQPGNDQNKSSTPFVTHPTTTLVAVSSSVVYYLANMALLRFPLCRFAVVARDCIVWSGYASVASLACLLLPDSISPSVYAIFALLPASELLYWLYHHKLVAGEDGAEFHVRRRGFRRFLYNVSRVLANSSGQRPQILPIRNRVIFNSN